MGAGSSTSDWTKKLDESSTEDLMKCVAELSIEQRNKLSQALSPTSVVRLIKYNYISGKHFEVAALHKKMWDLFAEKRPEGLLDFGGSVTDTSMFALLVFDSMDALEKYKAGLRAELLDVMKPLLAGPAEFDLVGPVCKKCLGCPKPRNDKNIVRVVQMRFKASVTDEELDKVFDQLWPTMASAKSMTVWSAWVQVDGKRTKDAIFGFMFEDEKALEEYKNTTRASMHATPMLKEVLENPLVIEASGTAHRPDVLGEDFP
jgi:hypothetical protein